MKKFALVLAGLLVLPACAVAEPKETKTLAILTVPTYGWLYCGFDGSRKLVDQYVAQGWRVSKEELLRYKSTNIYGGNGTVQCIGKSVTLVR